MPEHYLIARTPPGKPRQRVCVCGARWHVGYGSCRSQMRIVDKRVLVDGQAQMTREEFIARFDHHYADRMSSWLRSGILDTAREVEGGYCFWQIMAPYAEDMFGEAAEAIIKDFWRF